MPKEPKAPRLVRTFDANPHVVIKALERQRNRNLEYASALSKRLSDKAVAHSIAAAAASEASHIAAQRVVEITESKKALDPEATMEERAFNNQALRKLERMEPRTLTVAEQVKIAEKGIAKDRERDEVRLVIDDEEPNDDTPYPCENEEGTGFYGTDGQEYFFADLAGQKIFPSEDSDDVDFIEYEY